MHAAASPSDGQVAPCSQRPGVLLGRCRESCRTRLMFATRGSRDGMRVSLFKSSRLAYRDTRPQLSESSAVKLASMFLDFAACLPKWQEERASTTSTLVHPRFSKMLFYFVNREICICFCMHTGSEKGEFVVLPKKLVANTASGSSSFFQQPCCEPTTLAFLLVLPFPFLFCDEWGRALWWFYSCKASVVCLAG